MDRVIGVGLRKIVGLNGVQFSFMHMKGILDVVFMFRRLDGNCDAK